MSKKTIGIFVGSLRRDSFNKSIASYVSTLAPKDFEMRMIGIGNLPFYDQDLDDDSTPPEEWTRFRSEVKQLDGFLFVTPEYNRSFPAVLKNALDVGSRPYGENVWSGKPGGVISVSMGAIGGFGANQHLRQVLTFLNIPVLQQPEAYIGNAPSLLDRTGKVVNESTKAFLQQYMNAFVKWVDLISDAR